MPKSSSSSSTATVKTDPYPDTKPKASPSKANAWTPEQQYALFEGIWKKASPIRWEEIAKAVGRDVESCKNRYKKNLNKNIQDIIERSA